MGWLPRQLRAQLQQKPWEQKLVLAQQPKLVLAQQQMRVLARQHQHQRPLNGVSMLALPQPGQMLISALPWTQRQPKRHQQSTQGQTSTQR